MGKRISYDPYGHFLLRAPLFPVGLLTSVPETPDQLTLWLKNLWRDPLFREGLLLGSYDFSSLVEKEFNKANPDIDRSVLWALLRYACRFSSRCTPFGTFAGFAAGSTGPANSVKLNSAKGHQLHARPDMEYLMRVARFFESDRDVREYLLFSGNTSIYRVANAWHYVEILRPEGKVRKQYDIVRVSDMKVIGQILEYCRGGRYPRDIRSFLTGLGWDYNEVGEFVHSLITSQVLVSNLEPVVCGQEYLQSLHAILVAIPGNHKVIQSFLKLKEIFDRIENPGDVLSNLDLLESIVSEIPISNNRNHLIQVDMKLDASSVSVNESVTGQVLLGLRILKSLSKVNRQDSMKTFREAFIKRYGNRRVELVRVLDPETGIGLEGSVEGYWTDPVPWIDDLEWGPPAPAVFAAEDQGNPWLAAKLYELVRNQQLYLTLESSDLQSIGIHEGSWHAQMTALVELSGDTWAGDIEVHFIHGSSGNPAFLLGRFGFADPERTREWIGQLIEDECAEFPDMIFAEVVHLPEDRTGNVLQRPAFLTYEIPYLAGSTKDPAHQIPVSDLLISIENQKIVLWSASLEKPIRPYMTNAYNHQLGNVAIYKFLHRIRFQDPEENYKPDWGNSLFNAPFMPGIRFKNLVLASPVWLVVCKDIARWIHAETNESNLVSLTEWRMERQMPEEMLWIESDQELYVNWTNHNLVMALWDVIKSRKQARYRPFFFTGATPVAGPAGCHANQFVFCFKRS